MIPFETVPGQNKGKIRLFALSTCIWCRKLRRLLDSLGVAYEYVYVDLLEGNAKKETIAEMSRYNPNESYPTLVIDDTTCIVGFEEDEIRQKLS